MSQGKEAGIVVSTITSENAKFIMDVPCVGVLGPGQVWVADGTATSLIPGTPGGAGASTAAEVSVDTTGFAGVLSAADSNVQLALSTLDDHTHTYAWQHVRSHALSSASDHTGTITAAQHGSLGSGADHTSDLSANARVAVKKAGSVVGTRRGINFVEGTNVTLTIADDAGNEEVDVTITATGGVTTHEATYDHTKLHDRSHALSSGSDHTGTLGAGQHGSLSDGDHTGDLTGNARVGIHINGVLIGTRRILDLVEGSFIDLAGVDNPGSEKVSVTVTGVPGAGGGDVAGPSGATDQSIARFDGTTGKILDDSLATVNNDGAINIPTGQTYNINGSAHTHTQLYVSGSPYEASLTAAATKIPVSSAGGKLDTWISDAASGTKGLVQLTGQLGGTAASPTVVGATVTGPVALTWGAVADGEYVKRSGTSLIGGTGGSGGRAQTTWWVKLDTDDANNRAGYSIRQQLGPLLSAAGHLTSGNSVRVKLACNTTVQAVLDHVSIVQQATGADGTTTPTELTFSSGSGVTLAAGGVGEWSDWITFTMDDLLNYLVVMDFNSTGTHNWRSATHNGSNCYYKTSTASWNQQTVTGFSPLTNLAVIVTAVEVRTV